MFLTGCSVAMVTYCVMKKTTTCSPCLRAGGAWLLAVVSGIFFPKRGNEKAFSTKGHDKRSDDVYDGECSNCNGEPLRNLMGAWILNC